MFIETVLEELKKQGISQKELCKRLNIHEGTFTHWKKGNIPNFDIAMKVLVYLGISADNMYGVNQNLTNEEQEVINLYRKMNIQSREMIKAAMYTAAQSKSYSSDSVSDTG